MGTSELIPLSPLLERLDREFLACYLRARVLLFANANTRGANLPRIAMAEVWGHKVPVPRSSSEQLRIVARIKERMERVEEVEGLTESLDQESKQLPQAFRFDLWQECLAQFPMAELSSFAASKKTACTSRANTTALACLSCVSSILTGRI